MKICLPVDQFNGLESEISPNFKAAPGLLVVDSESGLAFGIDTRSGACAALPVELDAIICAGGVGRGMFNGLRMRGIDLYLSEAATVIEALAELAAGKLVAEQDVACCGGGHHHHAQEQEEAHAGCGCGGHAGEAPKHGGCCGGHDGQAAEHGCGCGGH